MTTGSIKVGAKEFCSAAACKPHLWKSLEKKTLIHKSKGRGRVESVQQPSGSVPLIYISFGKERFRINANILNNGSYDLFLPKKIAKEIGVNFPTQAVSHNTPPAVKLQPTQTSTSVQLPPSRCIICEQPCYGGHILSNGSNYHAECYSSLIDETKTVQSEFLVLHRHFFSTFMGALARLLQTDAYDRYVRNRAKLNKLQGQTKRIWDFWPNYPPDWEERRSNAIQFSPSCEICGEDQLLHVHHDIPLSKGGSNLADNLSVLCESCHSGEHGGKTFVYRPSGTTNRYDRTTQLIQQAIREQRKIVFTYRKYDEPDERRTVTPSEIKPWAHKRKEGNTMCVKGFCHTRNADRNFAIKRIYRLRIV